jgi:pimeloyl-ACP methyl ester carboxylesterase/nicotinamidase-related amidase
MTTLSRRFVSGAGVRLQLLDSGGTGLPVVFLHGVMGRGASWLPITAELAPRFRCIALDQRGHGRSDKPASGYDRESYVADLAAVVDELGLERFALVGHSTGALNAWVYAARHPERVVAAVLEDMHATPRGAEYLDEWRRWPGSWPVPFCSLSAVRRYFAGIRPSLGDYFAELFGEHDDGWRPVFASEMVLETIAGNEARSYMDELVLVSCPTLVVKGGSAGSEVTIEEAQHMAESLRRGRLAVIPGASHTVHCDQPAAYLAEVEKLLDEVVGTKGPEWSETRLELAARRQYGNGDAGFPIERGRVALVMIDMQREFATAAGGPFFVPEAARRVPAMRRLLDGFRAAGLPVIHTAFSATHSFLDRPRHGAAMPNRAAEAGSPPEGLFAKAVFVPELAPLAGEVVVKKPSYGAFFDTPLETILKRLGVETVVLAGTLTDCCVGTTARQAYERGLGAVVASDATATSLPEMHQAELAVLRRAFARVRTVAEILEEVG